VTAKIKVDNSGDPHKGKRQKIRMVSGIGIEGALIDKIHEGQQQSG
jgi:hypothetical protein